MGAVGAAAAVGAANESVACRLTVPLPLAPAAPTIANSAAAVPPPPCRRFFALPSPPLPGAARGSSLTNDLTRATLQRSTGCTAIYGSSSLGYPNLSHPKQGARKKYTHSSKPTPTTKQTNQTQRITPTKHKTQNRKNKHSTMGEKERDGWMKPL